MGELIEELGDYCPFIVIGGKTVRVLPDSARNSKNNDLGGMALDSDLSFTTLLANFDTAPVSNQSFTYHGKAYRIDNIHYSPGRLQVRITANDAAQGL